MGSSQVNIPDGFVLDKSSPPEGFILDGVPDGFVIDPPEGFVLDNKPSAISRWSKGIAEGAAATVSGMASLPIAGVAGLSAGLGMKTVKTGENLRGIDTRTGKPVGEVKIPSFDSEKAIEAIAKTQENIVLKPETKEGEKVAKVVSYPFEKLAELGGKAGDWVLDETNSPLAATAVHTGIETLPLWLFPALKKAPKLIKRIKNSNTYRMATIKERGVMLQSLEETMQKNNLTEGQVIRKWDNPKWRKEAIFKRAKTEVEPEFAPDPIAEIKTKFPNVTYRGKYDTKIMDELHDWQVEIQGKQANFTTKSLSKREVISGIQKMYEVRGLPIPGQTLPEKLSTALGKPEQVETLKQMGVTDESAQISQIVKDSVAQHKDLSDLAARKGNEKLATELKNKALENASKLRAADGPVVDKLISETLKEKIQEPKKQPFDGTGESFKQETIKLYSGPVEPIIDAIKANRINMPTKDMRYIEMGIGLPTWMADKYPQLKPIQDVVDNKFRNNQIIKHQYHKEYHESWKGLSKEELIKLGEILYRGDRLEAELNEQGLAKLSPQMKKAYLTIQEINKSMWQEDMAALLADLGEPKTQIEALMREYGNIPGWMPHPRRGRYFGKISNKEGETTYRQHFDDIVLTLTRMIDRQGGIGPKAALLKKKLERLAKAEDIIEFGENKNKLTEEAFMQISPAAIQEVLDAAIGEMRDLKGFSEQELNKTLKESVVNVIRERGFMAHAKQRKGVPGFDMDNWQQAILDHASAWAGFKSKVIASRELSKAWGKTNWQETPLLRKYGDKFVTDFFQNADRLDTTIDKARAVMFRTYLSGVVKSAAIQLTQNFIAAVPRLTIETKWSGAKLIAEMTRAAKDVITSLYTKPEEGMTRRQTAQAKRLSQEELAGLIRARNNGIVGTQMIDEVMGMPIGKYGTITNQIDTILGAMFKSTETFNRETTYITAFRIAKSRGYAFEQAAQFAEKIVDESHFRYGKTNLPPFARGNILKIGRAPYSFRHYPYSLVNLWMKLWASGAIGKVALFKSFAALLFFGGLVSFPFIKTLSSAYRQATGKDLVDDIKDELIKYGIPEDIALYGAPGAGGVDLSGSIATDFPTSLEEVLGVPASIARGTSQFITDIKDEDYQRAVEDFPLTPSLIKNPLAARRLSSRGLETRSGKPKVGKDLEHTKLDVGEVIEKSLGFQPAKLTEIYRQEQRNRELVQYWKDKKSAILRRFTKAYYLDGPKGEKIKKVYNEIKDFNKNVPVLVPPIKADTLRSALKPDIPTKRELVYEQ